MKKSEYDRIIVDTNEKMTNVINWFLANKDWLAQEEFHAPMDSGLIVMQEEGLDISFESNEDGTVNMAVYPGHLDFPAMTWLYDPATEKMTNHQFGSSKGGATVEVLLRAVLKVDNTDFKESIKYHSLMQFITHYEEIIHVDEKQTVHRTRHDAKKLRRNSRQPLKLVKRTFVIENFQESELHRHGEKRSYTKPDHEVQVRGYYCTTKTGKRVWVKPFSRYKDKGNRTVQEYKL